MDIELMEKKLYDACVEGDVEALEALMRQDKLILARLSLFCCFNQTPLHLACMLGHFEFTKSLLSYKPDFASRLDSQGCSPLHLASANGYAKIVKLLLQHDGRMCGVGDEDGRTPLHLAVMNGQYESVRELINVNCDYGRQGRLLHLCVMYNRLNILILLLESNLQDCSNFKDDHTGNTILHFATELRRMQIIKYLVKSTRQVVDVNAVNKNGLTALDIIEQMPRDAKTVEMKELLISAGTRRAQENEAAKMNSSLIPGVAAKENNTKKQGKMWKNSENINDVIPKKQKKKDKNLLVAATVIAAIAYQAALSPPGGVASVDATDHLAPIPNDLKPATSLLAYFYTDYSNLFWVCNTMAFMAALSVIFLYVSGASPKRRFFVWLVRLGMWITLTSMTIAYACAVLAITPSHDLAHQFKSHTTTVAALIIGLAAWLLLLCLSILVVVFRLLSYMVRTIFNTIKRAFTNKNKTQDAAAATFRTTPNAFIV